MITWVKYAQNNTQVKYAYVRGSYDPVPIRGTVNGKQILYNGKVGDTFSLF